MKLKSLLNEVQAGALFQQISPMLDDILQGTDPKSPQGLYALMTVLDEALTDANFHREASQLKAIFGDPKFAGDPMGQQDLEKMFFDLGKEIASLGRWQGYTILEAVATYIKAKSNPAIATKLMALMN